MDIQAEDGPACGNKFERICVFCGSRSGKKAIYTEVARELGTELVRRDINLVYGGGSIGLMGTVAQATKAAGGHVIGVIPKALMLKEICGNTVGELVVVDDMHQRKAEMARLANAFIALPGGFGTFEEVLEIITWAQLGIHKKPVGLLNVDGYYDAILTLFDKALDEDFLNLASHNIVVSAPTATELLDKLKNYTPTVDKSVPELTWDPVGESESVQKDNVPDSATDISKASPAPTISTSDHFHLSGRSDVCVSRSTGARAPTIAVTSQRIRSMYRMTSPDGVNRRSSASSGNNLLLPHVSMSSLIARPVGRFSVYPRTSSVQFRSSGRSTVGMEAVDDCSAGASAVVARLFVIPSAPWRQNLGACCHCVQALFKL